MVNNRARVSAGKYSSASVAPATGEPGNQTPLASAPGDKHVVVDIGNNGDGGPAVSVQAAIEFRNRTCPHAKNTSGRPVPYPICAFEDFAQFGKGVLLYFTMLKKLAVAFLVMLVLSAPQIFMCWTSPNQEVRASGIKVEKTMLGGLPSTNSSTIALPFVGLQVDKREVGAVLTGLDILIIAYFVVFLWHLRRSFVKEVTLSNTTEITASDFTVRVQNLPPDLTDRMELFQFFQERWGKVADCVICFNDSELVQMYLQRAKLKHELVKIRAMDRPAAELEPEINKHNEKVEKFDEKLHKFKEAFKRVAVDAYVTFNASSSKDACLLQYPNTWASVLFMPDNLRFKGHRIKVLQAVEPSNILFHNLKYSEASRRLRRLTTFLATVALMAVSLIVIFKASQMQVELSHSQVQCDPNSVPTRRDALNGVGVDCYCASLTSTQLVEQSDVCGAYATGQVQAKLLSAMIAITVVIINVLLKTTVVALVRWEKHSTVSSQERAITLKLFMGLFINTGILNVLVNGDLSVIGLGSIFHGQYADFSTGWYGEVGTSLTFTMILNVFNPHIIPVIRIPLSALYRRFRGPRIKTQKELNELYAGKEFKLSDRYAAALNTLFVSLLYSSGLPVLLCTASLTFALAYLCDKVSLLRFYRTPPKLDEELAMFTLAISQYAIVLHTAIAIWIYTAPDVVPPIALGSSAVDNIINSMRVGGIDDLYARIRNVNGYALLAVFILVTFGNLSRQVWQLRFCFRRRARFEVKKAEDDILDYFAALRHGIPIESYHMHDQSPYADAFLKTASLRQLQPEPPITEELAIAKAGKPTKKTKKKRTMSTDKSADEFKAPGEKNKAEKQDAHERKVTADFLDDKGMITVQCPTCAKLTNVLYVNGKAEQRFSCPFCGTVFSVA
ncbi:unnamed protein product (mitochondrion) [Plasmodiophora brassicae]|uniref:CSC1/OSCA1-like cytosolic domain-containing protein n=1 Tax=Plasmodiophora brassicae TaxID=37360 RepID=A0A3P3YMU5_PLABS|nr:unnamed protein product [Plasmodiophora brassicae]